LETPWVIVCTHYNEQGKQFALCQSSRRLPQFHGKQYHLGRAKGIQGWESEWDWQTEALLDDGLVCVTG